MYDLCMHTIIEINGLHGTCIRCRYAEFVCYSQLIIIGFFSLLFSVNNYKIFQCWHFVRFAALISHHHHHHQLCHRYRHQRNLHFYHLLAKTKIWLTLFMFYCHMA